MHTEPPAEPEEGDLDEEGASEEVQVPTETPPKAPEVPPAVPCEAGYSWESTAKHGICHKGVGATQANINNTSHSGKSTFTSETSGTESHYANCTEGVEHNATLYSPRNVGWYIWETKAWCPASSAQG
ncbi:hypothetical protein OG698_22885 [Streptomyces sp. NBC_01003]|uniref:hypothetical protein n=1 Tax=Streptomyces sp. NBC_01003 TaxID=2903714 RepID=UPI00386B0D43|nr:hypothetical protein OG698_22885 [Streptomyces sp. NBC_01003]